MASRRLAAASWLLLVVLAGQTIGHGRVWQSNLTLWTDAVTVADRSPRAWLNLGAARADRGDDVGATQALRRAVTWAADVRQSASDRAFVPAAAATILAHLALARGDWPAAQRAVARALRADPGFPPIQELIRACPALWPVSSSSPPPSGP